MVQGTNKTGEVSAYTFNGLGVRVGTEQILLDNSHGYQAGMYGLQKLITTMFTIYA